MSKFAGEMFVKQVLKNTTVKTTILRIFNTYGPGENLNYFKKAWLVFIVAIFGRKSQ